MNSREMIFMNLTNGNGEKSAISDEQLKVILANCLRDLRRFKGYTLKQVSDGTGIPIATVLRYESGENTPGAIQVYKFSCFYRIDMNEMFMAGNLEEDARERFFEELFGKR
ncbi:MAG: helix-turn-helix transcriptional regulator [Clostridia bacterium]|nr:helix-turn-helix transcriptional regulator [Clostridia bacterium]